MSASQNGHTEAVRSLINAGADVNAVARFKLEEGEYIATALIMAQNGVATPQIQRKRAEQGEPVAFGHAEIVQILLAAGARR